MDGFVSGTDGSNYAYGSAANNGYALFSSGQPLISAGACNATVTLSSTVSVTLSGEFTITSGGTGGCGYGQAIQSWDLSGTLVAPGLAAVGAGGAGGGGWLLGGSLSSGGQIMQGGRWLTPEELAEREKKSAEAARRGRKLLLSHLSAIQKAEFRRLDRFHVVSRSGRRYRIRLGRARNVDLLRPDGSIEAVFCIQPEQDVPDEDTVLAQKLLLECAEDDFLRIANRGAPDTGITFLRIANRGAPDTGITTGVAIPLPGARRRRRRAA